MRPLIVRSFPETDAASTMTPVNPQPPQEDSGKGQRKRRRRGGWGQRPPAATVAVFVVVVVLVSVSVSSAKDCPFVSFDDLPSKTLRSKVIFSGNASAPQPLPPLLPNATRVQVVQFQVNGDVLKTDPSIPLLPPKHNGKILVGWDLGVCGGREESLAHGQGYFVFLNGSSTHRKEEEDEEEEERVRTIYWSSGSLVPYNADSLKIINKFRRKNYGRRPKVTMRPQRQNLTLVDNLGSLDLNCRTSGRPTPKVTWYKDHRPISGSNGKRKISKNGAQLTVRRVKVSDSGIYFCEASNVIGSAKSSALKVIVRLGSSTQDGFPFDRCEDQNYCVNNGTCFVIPNINNVFCECAAEFTGLRCQDRRHGQIGEKVTPPFATDSSLKPFLVIGLILFLLNLFVLTVIAYCVAMTRYDNAKRLRRWMEEEDRECDIRANGAILRRTNNGLQDPKSQNKFSASGGMGGGGEEEEDEEARFVGLPQVLVTLIEESDRTTSVKTELPVTSGSAKRPDIRVYCPDARSLTFPTLTRPRLTAVSTTPSSAASSINLHSESIPEDQRQHC